MVAAHYKKDICYTVELAVRIFPATMRTFTKDTALSEQGRGVTRHVCINAQYGRGTAWARHDMCESAFYHVHSSPLLGCSLRQINAVHNPIFISIKIHFNIIFPLHFYLSSGPFSQVFQLHFPFIFYFL